NGCGTDGVEHRVRRAIGLEHLEYVFRGFRRDPVLLDLIDHLLTGYLVVQHVVDVIHAERTLLLRRALRRLGVTHQIWELLISNFDCADGVLRRALIYGSSRNDVISRPVNVSAGPLHDVDSFYSGHFFGCAGVNANDFCVRVRTTPNFTVQHAWTMYVIGVLSLS